MSNQEKLKLSGKFNVDPVPNKHKKNAWWQHPPYHNNRNKTKSTKEQQQ